MGHQWGFRHRTHGYAGGSLMGFVAAASVTDYKSGYLSHGGGFTLFGGIRVGPFFSIEGNWMTTFHGESYDVDDWGVVGVETLWLMSFSLDGKIHIPTRGPIEPYFQAGIGWAYVGATYSGVWSDVSTLFASGPTFNLGGGLDFYMGPFMSVGGRLLYRGIYLGEPATGRNKYSMFVNGVALDVNVTFHF